MDSSIQSSRPDPALVALWCIFNFSPVLFYSRLSISFLAVASRWIRAVKRIREVGEGKEVRWPLCFLSFWQTLLLGNSCTSSMRPAPNGSPVIEASILSPDFLAGNFWLWQFSQSPCRLRVPLPSCCSSSWCSWPILGCFVCPYLSK